MLTFRGKPFKVGIVHFMAYPEEVLGQQGYLSGLKTILEDDFFDVVEITSIPSVARNQALSLVRQSGIEVGFAAQPIILKNNLDPGSLDKVTRETSLSLILKAIEEASEFGAKIFGVASGPDPFPGVRSPESDKVRDEMVKRFTESLITISKRANTFGVTVALEPFDTVIEKKRLVGSSVLSSKIAEEVKSATPNFGIMVDLSHVLQLGESPEKCLESLGKHLVHVHIANTVLKDRNHPAYGDQHPRFHLPEGEIQDKNIEEFLQGLIKIGYLSESKCPVISLEVKPMKGEDPDVVLASSKRIIIRASAATCV